jgi:hypothetical protein
VNYPACNEGIKLLQERANLIAKRLDEQWSHRPNDRTLGYLDGQLTVSKGAVSGHMSGCSECNRNQMMIQINKD